MKPTTKSEPIEKALTALTGQDRREVIKTDKCMAAPFGCGGDATEFKDAISVREYRISGLCQKCQDAVFG